MHSARHGEKTRTILAATLFSTLPDALQAELRRRAPRRHFARGAIIQQAGDEASGFWLIEQGSVQVGVFRDEGIFRPIATLGDGDSYGELALVARRERVADAVALAPSVLLWIDGWRFEQAIASDPAILRTLLATMAEELQEVLGFVSRFRGGTARHRVAAVLVNAARHADTNEIRITQSEIAELAGATRATAAAALRAFEKEGALQRRYGRIEILEPAALEQLAV